MLNRVQLIGNLGRDIEVRYTPTGKAVGAMNLATTEKWKDQNGQKHERTEWHRCVFWNVSERLSPYLTKGKTIYIEGQLQTRKWTDKNGVERYTTEINVRDIKLLGGGNSNGGRARNDDPLGGDSGGGYDESPMEPITDDDIPFAWLLPYVLPTVMAGSLLA